MRLHRQLAFWLTLPPALIGITVALLFLSQVLQGSQTNLFAVAALMVAIYGAGGAIFFRRMSSAGRAVDDAIATESDVSETMSWALENIEKSSIVYWGSAGLLFTALATALFFPSGLGFAYFLVAALLIGPFAFAWDYFTAKQLLFAGARHLDDFHYVGRQIPLARKIAVIYIGMVLIAVMVLVLLVSAKISTTLEELAIQTETAPLDSIFSVIEQEETEPTSLRELQATLAPHQDLFLIQPDGTTRGVDTATLSPAEIASILRIGNGTSLEFVSANVSRFRRLPSGSVVVLSVPWDPYAGIPMQIAFYTLLIGLITAATFFVGTTYLSRDITRPIKSLKKVAAEISTGDFRSPLRVFTDDEIGDLTENFRETRSKLRRLLGSVGSSGGVMTDGVRVISGGTQTLIERATSQARLSEHTSDSLTKIRRDAESILRAAEGVSEATLDSSSRALELQASAEEVARRMDELFQSVDKTSSSTTQMDSAAREMTDRTDYLSSVGEEVLSFVAEMDSTVRELRQTAQSSAEISRVVRENAETGGSAVEQTVNGIRITQDSTKKTADTLDDLQRRISEISQILTVIEDITERTNLLSLNAAIIAAQAGEHGLGFSVVAEEIRELAERTRGSTKEISGIIKAIESGSREAVRAMHEGVELVDQNVNLARNASASLAEILSSASESFEMATKMARALQEQAQASQRLHEVTSRMSDHIAEISRAAREQASGTRLLAQESERVRDIALQVKNSTDQQSITGRGISEAMEQVASDARQIRDLLQQQLLETEAIAKAADSMLTIAQENQSVAEEFDGTVRRLAAGAGDFEGEVTRFKT
jgi:methyl-accepting chemotaxis protein